MKLNSMFIIALLSIFSFSTAQTLNSEIKDLAKGADLILTGKVKNQKSEWNKDKSRIYTYVSLDVYEYLKGEGKQSTISVVHLGGEVDGIGELYTHIPTFINEEEVLLFVKRDKENSAYTIYQGESGKVPLIKNPVNGELTTVQNKKLSLLKNEIKSANK